jgi:hypothetical protein
MVNAHFADPLCFTYHKGNYLNKSYIFLEDVSTSNLTTQCYHTNSGIRVVMTLQFAGTEENYEEPQSV